MKNKETKSTSTLSLSIFIVSAIVAFLYKFNDTTQLFIQEQIPSITNYSIDTVCLCIVILGLIIALVFRNQPERYSDDGDEEDGRLPYPLPHNPPGPPYHSPEPQTKTVSAEPIVQQIIIQPIIKQPISNDDSHRDHHNHDNDNSNSQHQQHNHQSHSNYKKKPVIQNYWKPKPRKKKKLIFRNYWNPKSWNSNR